MVPWVWFDCLYLRGRVVTSAHQATQCRKLPPAFPLSSLPETDITVNQGERVVTSGTYSVLVDNGSPQFV